MAGQPPITVLHVEDDEPTRQALGWVLRAEGFTVTESATGAEALRRVAEIPDLVLLDVQLPDMDGFEVCRRIKAEPATATIPVLHLSAHFLTSGDRVQGLEGGADAYLTKPVESRELVAQIRALVRAHRAERALRQSEVRFGAIFDQADVGIVSTDLIEWRYFAPNPGFCKVVGYTASEVERLSLTDITHPDDLEADLALARRMAAGEIPSYSLEKRYVRKDGEVVWGNLTRNLIRTPSGRPDFAVAVVQDITERKRAEAELCARREVLETVFDHVPVMIVFSGEQGSVSLVNRFFERTVGWTLEEARARDMLSALYPDPAEAGRVLDFIRRPPPGWADFRMRTKDGRVLDTSWANVLLEDGTSIGIGLDVTERRRGEQQLDESRRRLQALFDHALDAYLLADDRARYVDANPAACALLGYSREELLRLSVWDLTPPGNRESGRRAWPEFLATGRLAGEYVVLCKDGSVRAVDFRAVANILPGLHLSAIRDITARKHTEERLRRSEALLAEAQHLARIGSWNWDITTDVVLWSDEHYRIFGLRPQEVPVTYALVLSRIHPDDRAVVQATVEQAFRDRKPFECCFRAVHDDGTVRVVQSRGQVVLDEGGRPVRMFGTVQDVTEQRRAESERERLHQEVVASRAQLQALSRRLLEIQEEERRRIAHELHDEVGQILTAVRIHLHALKGPCGPAAHGRLADGIAAVDRAVEQVRNLALDLRPGQLDVLGLEAALKWYLDRQSALTGLTIHLDCALSAERLPSSIETTCFRLVQESLTNTARHARARQAWVELVQHGAELHLLVRDDGAGFDVTAARRRALLGGSFGLLGMQERVELLGGQIELESEPGAGTRVSAVLPLHPAPAPEYPGEGEP